MISLSQLPKLGIGTSRAGSLGSRLSEKRFCALLQVAAQSQANLIDTADAYGSGDAERLVGNALKQVGTAFFVITKGGLPYVHMPSWLSPLNQLAKKAKQKFHSSADYSSGYLLRSVQRSNKRLGIEVVDAFLLHEPTWPDIATSDCWEGLWQIKQAGLARYVGVSTSDERVVEEGIRSGQVELVETSVMGATAPRIIGLSRANDIPVIGNTVLGQAETIRKRFLETFNQRVSQDWLGSMSIMQFLIAAALATKKVDVALCGTGSIEHLKHNAESLKYVPYLTEHVNLVRSVFND
jgi:aryl-alcohol dehydrogenase-like predicted oxidoreductase